MKWRLMPDQTHQELSDELGPELPVFLRYSRTMLAAQLLEFTVFQLAHLRKTTPKDMERALRKLEGLLKQPPKDASKQLDLDPALLSDLMIAIDIRNILAHDFLTRFRVEYAVRGEAVGMATAFLDLSEIFISDVQRRLDKAAEARLLEQGIEPPYLDDEGMEEIVDSLRRWSEDDAPG